MTADLYKLLQVSRNASLAEIKSSYRRLALLYHPDVNNGDETKRKQFICISDAYNILCDMNRRATYDATLRSPQYREVKVKPHKAPRGTISPKFFNEKVWRAWHYGDDATSEPSIKQTRNWMNMPGNAHQAYYVRRSRKAQEEIATNQTDNRQTSPQENSKSPPNECCIS